MRDTCDAELNFVTIYIIELDYWLTYNLYCCDNHSPYENFNPLKLLRKYQRL